MRVLFIGQAPSLKSFIEGRPAMCGTSGTRLARVMGLSREDMLYKHDFINLLDSFPGRTDINRPRGDAWPVAEARARAILLLPKLLLRKRVVLLGNQVKDAFRIPHHNLPYFTWKPFKSLDCPLVLGAAGLHSLKVAVCPHPSGISRWWDSESNLAQARAFFAEMPFKRKPSRRRTGTFHDIVSLGQSSSNVTETGE